MTIRDLGYRSYEGERRPASENVWVLLRYGLWRAWGSWVTKLTFLFALGPALITVTLIGGIYWLGTNMGEGGPPDLEAGRWVRGIFDFQLWLFVTVLSLRGGAGVIAEDFTFKAFQFYLAKPVTPEQYLVGRAAALAILVFGVTFVPALFVVLGLVGTGGEDAILERAGLLLPALLNSLVIAVVVPVVAIGISSLSKSRALTMSAFIVLFVVPHVLAILVSAITDSPWAYLASLPGLLGIVGDGLFKIGQDVAEVRWYHAAPILAALTGLCAWLSLSRIRGAEVIT